jgi:septum formation protein
MSTAFKKVILASASPRRRELLTGAGFALEILPPDIEEVRRPTETPKEYSLRNAREKSQAIHNKNPLELAFIISADTIVVAADGTLLEKPSDAQHATSMLRLLSGQWHTVFTAYAILECPQGTFVSQRVIETRVKFRPLGDEEIQAYIATGEAFDKAGSYGIQGYAASFVESLDGSYTNVVGLPLSHIIEDLKNHLGELNLMGGLLLLSKNSK